MVQREIIRKISAGIVALLLVLLMVFVLLPPATSVILFPGTSEDSIICNESTITFSDVNLTIRGDELIPIDFLNFSIYEQGTDENVAYVTFTVEGTELSDSPSGTLTVTKTTTIPSDWYNYGYGYGYDEQAGGNPYYFGYGYGYGYGDSSYGDITILYDITYTTSQTGTFYTKFLVNSSSEITDYEYESSPSTSFEVRSVPWMGEDVSSTKAEEISGSGTVDALDESNVTVDVTGSGSTVVMIANYTDNPGSEGLSSSGFFFDVYVPDVSNATVITVKHWVTSTPSAEYQYLYYWNSTTSSWKVCSNTGYTADTSTSPYVGYNYAVLSDSSHPCLDDFIGLPFYSGGEQLTIALDVLSEEYYTSGDQVDISGYILPAETGETLAIEVNDSGSNSVFTDQLYTDSNGEFSTNFILGGLNDAVDGLVTIYAALSGTSTQVSQTFYYDTANPSATIDDVESTVNTAPDIMGGSSDAIALSNVYVKLNFTNNTDTYYWDATVDTWITDETWNSIVQTGTTDTWTLSDAPETSDYNSNQLYMISGYAKDQVDNSGSTVTETFTFDGTDPSSGISSPTTSSKLNALNEISGTASDVSEITGVEVQIINASSYYWNGTSWVSEVSWLDATGTTSWTYDTSSVSWSSCGENSEFTLKSRATDTFGNVETASAGVSFTYGITTDVEPMETSYRGGAYHGARINWTNSGMSSYKVYASLSDITNVSASGVTLVDTVSGTNTTSFSNLSSSMWGEQVYYAVTTVDENGVESPATFIGNTNHTKCWAYKIEIQEPTSILHTSDNLGWTVHYKIRLLTSTFDSICTISEFLGPNATDGGDIPNRPVLISKSSMSTYPFTFFGTNDWETSGTYAGGADTQQYKGWIMIWNKLPSAGGYWEAYSEKYVESPITIS